MSNQFMWEDDNKRGLDTDVLVSCAGKLFCEKGYTNTSLKDIAIAYGITEKELGKLYKSKEDVYIDVLISMVNLELLLIECDDVQKMLIAVVDELKACVKANNLKADFISALITAKDVPNKAREALRTAIQESKLYDAVGAAQLQGKICKGNTLDVILRFMMASFELIKGYTEGGMKVPESKWFLDIVQYCDDVNVLADKELIKRQASVISAFVSDFNTILFVDLDDDSTEVYQTEGEDDGWVQAAAGRGFEEFKIRLCDKYILPSDRDWFMENISTENIKRHLDEEPVYCINHKVLMHGEPVDYQTKIVLDPMYAYGNKILFGGHRVYQK
ncbi:MAG: hypothetical protein IK068_00760 [Lachnospiraceae bacterium]|nr:hypothetical protein [Lachnospiraceae bacterium]